MQEFVAMVMVYIHKWDKFHYLVNSTSSASDAKILCISAIFLSCKTGESLRTIRDIASTFFKVLEPALTIDDLNEVSMFCFLRLPH